jgi:hypothetical protein
MLDITSEEYTPEPDVQSYRSLATVRAKLLWVMNLRVISQGVIFVAGLGS